MQEIVEEIAATRNAAVCSGTGFRYNRWVEGEVVGAAGA
jgi:hypothetical protein